jgi:hypothetical protein
VSFIKYYKGGQAEKDEMGLTCSTHGSDEKCVQYFGRKPEGKRPLGRPRRGWMDNIRMDLREIGWEVVDGIHLAQYRDQWLTLVSTVMNLRAHKKR